MDANKKSQTRSLPKKFLNQPPVVINPILLQSKSNSNLSINQNSQSQLVQTQHVINNIPKVPQQKKFSKSNSNLSINQNSQSELVQTQHVINNIPKVPQQKKFSKSNSNLSINQNSQSELMQTQIGQPEFEKQIIPEELILLYISINIFIY